MRPNMLRLPIKEWMARALLLLTVGLALVLMASACSTYKVAWVMLSNAQDARNLTAEQLASVARAKHQSCLSQHAAGSEGYRSCIAETRKMLATWQDQVRPAINSAIAITAAAIQTAEKVGNKKLDWLQLAKPAICGVLRALKAWANYFPDKGQAVLGALGSLEGIVCSDG